MFSVYCKQCGSVLLLGPANIVAVQNTSNGIVVPFQCHAGHHGVWSVGATSDRPAPLRQRAHAPLRTTSPDLSASTIHPRRLHLTHRGALHR
jgi:RNase P subunit RPR2